MALTRLAQNTPLRLKAYYDCNPPAETHWTCRVFIAKSDPDARPAITLKSDAPAVKVKGGKAVVELERYGTAILAR